MRCSPNATIPRAPRPSWDFTLLRSDFDAQNKSTIPAHRVFPDDDPRIPPSTGNESRESTPQTKRTVFAPYELSVLQALWTEGRGSNATNRPLTPADPELASSRTEGSDLLGRRRRASSGWATSSRMHR
ncbi:hypothetical protein BMF94_3658 [Rhodotorula taiwanensis]|uniref:Uncharacterized protein n=1 Tax=Rhodotorula taiwanensis TaxID=741276 RepID=A0A2S5B961_9BASI|nr:hypothetical protein BMF94_3658 [Rhodotorula taiwanensis]